MDASANALDIGVGGDIERGSTGVVPVKRMTPRSRSSAAQRIGSCHASDRHVRRWRIIDRTLDDKLCAPFTIQSQSTHEQLVMRVSLEIERPRDARCLIIEISRTVQFAHGEMWHCGGSGATETIARSIKLHVTRDSAARPSDRMVSGPVTVARYRRD